MVINMTYTSGPMCAIIAISMVTFWYMNTIIVILQLATSSGIYISLSWSVIYSGDGKTMLSNSLFHSHLFSDIFLAWRDSRS